MHTLFFSPFSFPHYHNSNIFLNLSASSRPFSYFLFINILLSPLSKLCLLQCYHQYNTKAENSEAFNDQDSIARDWFIIAVMNYDLYSMNYIQQTYNMRCYRLSKDWRYLRFYTS